MKRILSLDGGGIRGALSLGYLQKIEDILRDRYKSIISSEKFRLYQYFDLIGGTSTGSNIADVRSLKEMSNSKNCSILYDIGQSAAEKEIEAIDFPSVFDLKNI